jgi:uncharacterized membrane protein
MTVSMVFALLVVASAVAFVIVLIRVLFKKSRGRLLFVPLVAFIAFAVIGVSSQTPEEKAAQAADTRAARTAKEAAAEKEAAATAAAASQAQAEQDALKPSTVEVACQDQAQRSLSLPNSAKFPGVMETVEATVVGSKGIWSSWIEGDNALGGTVRTYFDCTYDDDFKRATLAFKN